MRDRRIDANVLTSTLGCLFGEAADSDPERAAIARSGRLDAVFSHLLCAGYGLTRSGHSFCFEYLACTDSPAQLYCATKGLWVRARTRSELGLQVYRHCPPRVPSTPLYHTDKVPVQLPAARYPDVAERVGGGASPLDAWSVATRFVFPRGLRLLTRATRLDAFADRSSACAAWATRRT